MIDFIDLLIHPKKKIFIRPEMITIKRSTIPRISTIFAPKSTSDAASPSIREKYGIKSLMRDGTAMIIIAKTNRIARVIQESTRTIVMHTDTTLIPPRLISVLDEQAAKYVHQRAIGIIRLIHSTKKYSESISETSTEAVRITQKISISGDRRVILSDSENLSEKSFVLYPPHTGHS